MSALLFRILIAFTFGCSLVGCEKEEIKRVTTNLEEVNVDSVQYAQYGDNQVLYSRNEYHNYPSSTFSFEYATANDHQLTNGDWDMEYGNGWIIDRPAFNSEDWINGIGATISTNTHGGININTEGPDYYNVDSTIWANRKINVLNVAMSGNNRGSVIADIGVVDFESLYYVPLQLDSYHEQAIARENHVYIVHSKDQDTDIYAKFIIIEMSSNDMIKINWVRSNDNLTFTIDKDV